jgi:hypothetical protein
MRFYPEGAIQAAMTITQNKGKHLYLASKQIVREIELHGTQSLKSITINGIPTAFLVTKNDDHIPISELNIGEDNGVDVVHQKFLFIHRRHADEYHHHLQQEGERRHNVK